MSNTIEYDDRQQYHNKQHQVVLKDGRVLYGLVSRVDYANRAFYLLDQNKPGMLGSKTAGTRIAWEDCKSVKAENQRVGSFDDSMIPLWDQWDRQSMVDE